MTELGIRLLVEKFDETFKFYSEVLGLEVAWGKPGDVYGSFRFGENISLAIFKAELMDKAVNHSFTHPRRNGDTAVLVINTNNLDTLFNDLKSQGVKFETEPHDMPGWGNRCAHLRDPEGNLIELSTALNESKWEEDLVQQAKEYNV